MENALRSERSRKAVLQAALAIIARDGPARLTLDAIAKESGISKGGLIHQFGTKEAVLRALLEHQAVYFQQIAQDYLSKLSPGEPEPTLKAQITTLQAASQQTPSIALALVGAMAQDPKLLAEMTENAVKTVDLIRAEAKDPESALLRWAAARGLMLMVLFGLNPFSDAELTQLFQRLIHSDI